MRIVAFFLSRADFDTSGKYDGWIVKEIPLRRICLIPRYLKEGFYVGAKGVDEWREG